MDRKRIWIFSALLTVVLTISLRVASLIAAGRPRELARADHPDGTATLVVAKPRLMGLFGIEIVQEECAADGRRHSGFVQDLCNSWDEARRRYENKDGGGLLTPIPSERRSAVADSYVDD